MIIKGGKSRPGSITIASDMFVSTARREDGQISCLVERIPEKIKDLHAMNVPYMPKTVRLAIFLKETMTKKDLVILFIFFVIGYAIMNLLNLAGMESGTSENFWLSNIFLFAIFGVVMRTKIASWHAAEHMAIAAYRRSGATSIDMMKKEDPVDPNCGTRLYLPSLLAVQLVDWVVEAFASDGNTAIVLAMAVFIVSMECVLQIDAWIGFNNLVVAREASFIIQKYIGTKRPGDTELLVAQRALLELIAAHGNEEPKRVLFC